MITCPNCEQENADKSLVCQHCGHQLNTKWDPQQAEAAARARLANTSTEEQFVEKEKFQPWLTIWTKPRETIRKIVTTNPEYGVAILATVQGTLRILDEFASEGTVLPWILVVPIAIIGGLVFGNIGVRFSAAILAHTSQWIGGKGDSIRTRTVLAWASLPSVVDLIGYTIIIMIYGDEVFQTVAPTISNNPLPFLVFGIVQIITGLFSISLLVIGVSEVHKIPLWKSVIANILPAVLIFLLLLGCGLLL